MFRCDSGKNREKNPIMLKKQSNFSKVVAGSSERLSKEHLFLRSWVVNYICPGTVLKC